MKKIKAIIFDLDGTLGDTLPLCIRAFRESVEPLIGRSVSAAEIIATFGPSEEGTIMALAPNYYNKGVADYLKYYEAYHEMCSSPFPGIRELLEILKEKGVRVAMVTGKGRYSTAISLKKFGLEHYFEVIETGLPGGPRKPEGIRCVLNYFAELTKDDIIYVGDAPSDITASRKAGVAVIAAAWAETAEPEKLKALEPNEIFFTIPEFAEWLHARI